MLLIQDHLDFGSILDEHLGAKIGGTCAHPGPPMCDGCVRQRHLVRDHSAKDPAMSTTDATMSAE